MKILLFLIGILGSICVVSLFFVPKEIPVSVSSISIKANQNNLPTQKIYLVENYDLDDGESSREFTDAYKKISEIAIKRLKKNGLNINPELVVNETSSTLNKFDPERIWEIVDHANENRATAVIGFGWSTMAAIAAKRTNELKIPFISPTAVVKSVFDGEYSRSLGLPVWDAAKGFEKLYTRLEQPKIIAIHNKNNIQEVEYTREVSKRVTELKLIEYDDIFPVEKTISEIEKTGEDAVIFIPGYTELAENLFKIGQQFEKIRFIVGPQWPDESEVLNGLKNETYCISDFSNLVRNKSEFEFLKSEFESAGMDIPCIFFLKVYDA